MVTNIRANKGDYLPYCTSNPQRQKANKKIYQTTSRTLNKMCVSSYHSGYNLILRTSSRTKSHQYKFCYKTKLLSHERRKQKMPFDFRCVCEIAKNTASSLY